ncbi:Superoxide dismutase [Minicystis rosea]|nr:Superoxide dismutase [Minicystis rosea]
MSMSSTSIVLGMIALSFVASCAHGETCAGVACGQAPSAPRATGTFQAKEGTTVSGTVEAIEEGNVVRLRVNLKGAPPGIHGIHIHEKGDCSAPDFTSAGGHFNPTNASHACPPTEPRHAGDFGNIEIAADGTGRLDMTSDHITVSPGATSVVGRSVVLHHGKDDCASQPAGDSGMRIGCAVLK